jgi:uncharacterized membrane protein YbhN (UPF0104 family)
VIVVLAVAVLITVIVVDRHTLAQSLSAIGGLDLSWFALAIVCECLSLTAFGLSRAGCCGPTGTRQRSAR